MVVLGVLLILLGAFSSLVLDNKMDVGSMVWDMDLIGTIFILVGVGATLLGLFMTAMYTNTSHSEEHDVLVDHVPGEEPKKVVRRRKRH